MNKSLTKHFTQTFTLCAAALGLAAFPADALEISGLIKVNGLEQTDVMIVAYDCSDSRELAYAYTVATDNSSGIPINFSMNVASDSVRLELYYSDTPDITPIPSWCRAYVDCGQIIPVNGAALVNADMGCTDSEAPGVMDHGYWKTHPDEWPVDSLAIGGRTLNKMQLMFLLRLGERGDKTLHMLRELVAAKLNVAAGNDESCIQTAIDTADGWLMRFQVGSGISASNINWKRAMNVVNTLTEYNAGKLCAPAGKVDEDDDNDGNGGIGCHRRGHKFHGWPLGWRMRR